MCNTADLKKKKGWASGKKHLLDDNSGLTVGETL